MKLMFDGKEWDVTDSSKNMVEVAKEHGIYIPAPCYYKKENTGCCKGCLIEINGKIARACITMPEDGMNIIYDRDDLIDQRELNLKKYALGIIEPESDGCGCGGSCGDNCTCGAH